VQPPLPCSEQHGAGGLCLARWREGAGGALPGGSGTFGRSGGAGGRDPGKLLERWGL